MLAIAFSLAILLLHSKLILLVDSMQGKVDIMQGKVESLPLTSNGGDLPITSEFLMLCRSTDISTWVSETVKSALSVPFHFSYLLSLPC